MEPFNSLGKLAETTPKVADFLKNIPLSHTWIADLAAGDPIPSDFLPAAFCAHGCEVAPGDVRNLNSAIRKATGPLEQFIVAAGNGHRHQLWIKATPTTIDGAPRVLVAVRDVSVEHKLEEALKAARQSVHELEFATHCSPVEAVHLALNDALTGLPNRRAFDLELAKACQRGNAALCVMDIDRFKAVNDSLGHVVGDRLLQAVAAKLRTHTRGKDFVGRLAGDEFAVILNDITTEDAAYEAVERLMSVFGTRLDLDDVDIRVSLSGGVAVIEANETPEVAYRCADLSMHAAKGTRRGTLHVHSASDRDLGEHVDLTMVKAVLSDTAVALALDPIYDVDGHVFAHEVSLARRHGGTGGDIDAIFETAEKFGLGTEFVLSLIREVFEAASMRPGRTEMHLRLPRPAYTNPKLIERVAHMLETTGLSPAAICLEVPAEVACLPESEAVITGLAETGVGLIFGNWDFSFSDVERMRNGPYTMAKFSHATTRAMARDLAAGAYAQAAIALIGRHGIVACARGVHSTTMANAVFALGVSAFQGQRLTHLPIRQSTHRHLTSVA